MNADEMLATIEKLAAPFRATLAIGPLWDDCQPAFVIDPRCSFTIGDVRELVAGVELLREHQGADA